MSVVMNVSVGASESVRRANDREVEIQRDERDLWATRGVTKVRRMVSRKRGARVECRVHLHTPHATTVRSTYEHHSRRDDGDSDTVEPDMWYQRVRDVPGKVDPRRHTRVEEEVQDCSHREEATFLNIGSSVVPGDVAGVSHLVVECVYPHREECRSVRTSELGVNRVDEARVRVGQARARRSLSHGTVTISPWWVLS